jgi:hypothetical protein
MYSKKSILLMGMLFNQSCFANGGLFFYVAATDNRLTIKTTIPAHYYY